MTQPTFTPGGTRAEPVRAPQGRGFGLKEILAVVTLGVVFGFLYYLLVQGWNALAVAMGPFGDLAQNVVIGGWFVVAPLALFVVRKPGAGLVAEIMASIVEFVFLGSPVGPILLLSATIQGLGSELGFALFRYRRYDLVAFLTSGLTAAIFSFVYSTIRFGWFGQSLFEARLGLHLVSGLVLCGVLGWVIARALLRTGVLRDLPAGRAVATAADA
ncbi:MAG: ECF transporter S component [Propionibacteriaceae bacterium]|nr:ECF transporter S component [Propionibacteriaceae bacterium]